MLTGRWRAQVKSITVADVCKAYKGASKPAAYVSQPSTYVSHADERAADKADRCAI